MVWILTVCITIVSIALLSKLVDIDFPIKLSSASLITDATPKEPLENAPKHVDEAKNSIANNMAEISVTGSAPKEPPEYTPKRVNEEKDSIGFIANTMTAIGVLIAAFTLLLSLGTAWFMQEIKKIDAKKKQLEQMKEEFDTKEKQLDQLQKKFSDRAHVAMQLLEARVALQEWIEMNARSEDRWATYNKLSMWLEMLMSDNKLLRKRAFAELITYFPKEAGEILNPVKVYSESCHNIHGGTADHFGFWCKVFLTTERNHWAVNAIEGRNKELF